MCTEKDKRYFGPFVDINTQGIEDVWQNLYCIDDVDKIKFQGGFDLKKEQSLKIYLIGCNPQQKNCVSDKEEVSDFFSKMSFVSVQNQNTYMPQKYGDEKFIERKATVVKHSINPYNPVNIQNNIRMDTVQTQDDRN